MSRNILITTLFLATLSAIGCGGGARSNSGANGNTAKAGNANGVAPQTVNIDPANMPPGLSASPIQQPANMVGVNANAVQPRGGTPTPGIPSPAEIKRGMKPGVTPTPGIPSPEEIRKMLGKPPTNVNARVPPMKSDVPMMKSNRPMAGKPTP